MTILLTYVIRNPVRYPAIFQWFIEYLQEDDTSWLRKNGQAIVHQLVGLRYLLWPSGTFGQMGAVGRFLPQL